MTEKKPTNVEDLHCLILRFIINIYIYLYVFIIKMYIYYKYI